MKRVYYDYNHIPPEYLEDVLTLTQLVAQNFNLYITAPDMYHLWRDASAESGFLWCYLDNFKNQGEAGKGILINILGGLIESKTVDY